MMASMMASKASPQSPQASPSSRGEGRISGDDTFGNASVDFRTSGKVGTVGGLGGTRYQSPGPNMNTKGDRGEPAIEFRKWQTSQWNQHQHQLAPDGSGGRLPEVLPAKRQMEGAARLMEQPPSMVFTGDLQDGSYWIPVENAPDEFVNDDFEKQRQRWCPNRIPTKIVPHPSVRLSSNAPDSHRGDSRRSGASSSHNPYLEHIPFGYSSDPQTTHMEHPAGYPPSQPPHSSHPARPNPTNPYMSGRPQTEHSYMREGARQHHDWSRKLTPRGGRKPSPAAMVPQEAPAHDGVLRPWTTGFGGYNPHSQHWKKDVYSQWSREFFQAVEPTHTCDDKPPSTAHSAPASPHPMYLPSQYDQFNINKYDQEAMHELPPMENDERPVLQAAIEAGSGARRRREPSGTWLTNAAYAYGYPSMRIETIGASTVGKDHPMKKTPKMRGRNLEVFMPSVTLESTFMQHSMMKGSNALNRQRLKELNDERAIEGTQSLQRMTRRVEKIWRQNHLKRLIQDQGKNAVEKSALQGQSIVQALRQQIELEKYNDLVKADERRKMAHVRWTVLAGFLLDRREKQINQMKQAVRRAAQLRKQAGAFINKEGMIELTGKTDEFGVKQDASEAVYGLRGDVLDAANIDHTSMMKGGDDEDDEHKLLMQAKRKETKLLGKILEVESDDDEDLPTEKEIKHAREKAKMEEEVARVRKKNKEADEAKSREQKEALMQRRIARDLAENIMSLPLKEAAKSILGMNKLTAALTLSVMVEEMNKDALVVDIIKEVMAEVDDMVDGKQTDNAELIKKLTLSASVNKRHDNIGQAAALAQGVVKAKSQVPEFVRPLKLVVPLLSDECVERVFCRMTDERIEVICTKLPAEVYSSKGNSENFVERAMEYTSPYEASQLLAHMRETEFVKAQIMQMDDTRAVAVCSMFEGDQASRILNALPISATINILLQMNPNKTAEFMAHLDLCHVVGLLDHFPLMKVVSLMNEMRPELVREIFEHSLTHEVHTGGQEQLGEIMDEMDGKQSASVIRGMGDYAGQLASVISTANLADMLLHIPFKEQVVVMAGMEPMSTSELLMEIGRRAGDQANRTMVKYLDPMSDQKVANIVSCLTPVKAMRVVCSIPTYPERSASVFMQMELQAAAFMVQTDLPQAMELITTMSSLEGGVVRAAEILNTYINPLGYVSQVLVIFTNLLPELISKIMIKMHATNVALVLMQCADDNTMVDNVVVWLQQMASLHIARILSKVEEVSTEFTTHMLQALGDVSLVKTLNEMESLSAGHVIDSLPFDKGFHLVENMFPQPAGEALQFINTKTAARMLMKVSHNMRTTMVQHMSPVHLGPIADHLQDFYAGEVLDTMDDEAKGALLLASMSPDKAIVILEKMTDLKRKGELLTQMDQVKASVLIGKLNLSRGGSEKHVGDEIVLMAEEASPDKTAKMMGLLGAERAANMMMMMHKKRRQQVATLLDFEEASVLFKEMTTNEAANTLSVMAPDMARKVYHNESDARKKKMDKFLPPSLKTTLNVQEKAVAIMINAIYVPPGNWGKALKKVMKVVKLKSSMDRAVGFMTELFQEVRAYKRPGRATVAVIACLALLHSQGRKEVMPHIKHYGGQKCVVPKEGMELQTLWVAVRATVRPGPGETGTSRFLQQLQLNMIHGEKIADEETMIDIVKDIVTNQIAAADVAIERHAVKLVYMWVKALLRLHDIIRRPVEKVPIVAKD